MTETQTKAQIEAEKAVLFINPDYVTSLEDLEGKLRRRIERVEWLKKSLLPENSLLA
jgi:hypothetical protein